MNIRFDFECDKNKFYDIIITNFDRFTKTFHEAIKEGFAELGGVKLPNEGKLHDQFTRLSRKKLPLEYKERVCRERNLRY